MKKCIFCGEKDCSDMIENIVRRNIKMLVEDKKIRIFYIENTGSFGRMVLQELIRMKNVHPNIEYISISNKERVKKMLCRADCIVCYVNRYSEEVIEIEDYARKNRKRIIFIAEFLQE